MEAPMSASQGPMRSLPRKLGSLLPGNKHGLLAEEKTKIRILQEDLRGLIDKYLLEPSEVESPVSTAHSWMKDVRDLSYDIDDFIYELTQAGTSGLPINVLQRPPRFKVSRSRFPPKPKRRRWIIDEISGFMIRVREAIRRHKEYLGDLKRRPSSIGLGQRPSPSSPCSRSGTGIRLVSIDSSIKQLCGWLAKDEQPDHKVASIVGTAGVGKTTIAREVYRRLGGQFQCLAFVQTPRTADMKGLLTSILSQVRPHHLPDSCEMHTLLQKIYEHLQDKTYLIVIDDLWSLSTWDTVNRALPKGELFSRILTTTEVNVIAQKCCADNSKYFSAKKEDNSACISWKTKYNSSYMLSEKQDISMYMPLKKKGKHMHMPLKKEDNYTYIIKKGPLCDDESREFLLSTVFGHQAECPQGVKEVSNQIIKRSGGLPLTINILASLLARLPDSSIEQWNYIKDSLSSGLTRNNSLEGINQVLNLCYNILPHSLKACMLYLCMYEEDRVILKDDLVNQWIVEGFVCVKEGDDGKEVARSYFDELVTRGIIQPVDTNCNDEILSCSVHNMVLHFIRYKSIEENFSIAIDHSQTTIKLADKVRRLALHFSDVEDATPPTSVCMRLSNVRSLAFSGLLKCMPYIVEFRFIQVLILKIWANPDNRSGNLTKPDDLTEISQLFRLKYFHLDACHLTVGLPTQMQQLKYLVAWEIDAQVTAVPSDIVDLPGLLYLRIPSEAHLPTGFGRMTSLHTLGVFDLSRNSTEDVMSLGEMTSLQDLRLTCTTLQPGNLENNLECLGSVIRKLSNLKCVTLVPAVSSHVNTQNDAGASSMSTSWHGLNIVPLPPTLLQRLELSRRCCIFSSLPQWIKELTKLCSLKIAVRKVSQEDVVILKGLPSLTALSLFVWTAPAIRIIFDNEGFSVLKYFKFVCAAPRLEFLDGAVPNVRKLHLGFNANRMEIVGFERLTGLNEISIKIGGTGVEECDRKSAQSVLTDTIGMHPSTPIINVQLVEWNFCGDDEKHIEMRKEIPYQILEKQNVTATESSDVFFEKEAKPRASALDCIDNQVEVSDEQGIQENNLEEDVTRTCAVTQSTFLPQSTYPKLSLIEKHTDGVAEKQEVDSGGYGEIDKLQMGRRAITSRSKLECMLSDESAKPTAQAITSRSKLECMLSDESAKPTALALSLLDDITRNFSIDREIGRGGFAVVYKGVLDNGMVAVKKLYGRPIDDEKFIEEVRCLMMAKQKNIVRFLGYCSDTQGQMLDFEGRLVWAEVRQRLLCFEYLPKGSLDKQITDASCGLEWSKRYNIITGICDGLYYLHQKNILHLDLKPANILLDENMMPKIADFGISRCFHENQSQDITTVGSMGYLAPESVGGQVTLKSDLYTLGITILEILTGEKGYPDIDNVLEMWSNRMEKSQRDRQLMQVRVCTEIAIACTNSNPAKRPNTQQIVDRLDATKSVNNFASETGSSKDHQALPWRNNMPGLPRQVANVALVANTVAKLSIQDKTHGGKDKTPQGGTSTPTTLALPQDGGESPATPTSTKIGIIPENQPKEVPVSESPARAKHGEPDADPAVPVIAMGVIHAAMTHADDSLSNNLDGADHHGTIDNKHTYMQKGKLSTWKRAQREKDRDAAEDAAVYPTQGGDLGATRTRLREEEDDDDILPAYKKHYYPVPSLERCLGADNLRRLREEE